jgi:hypothetical protein
LDFIKTHCLASASGGGVQNTTGISVAVCDEASNLSHRVLINHPCDRPADDARPNTLFAMKRSNRKPMSLHRLVMAMQFANNFVGLPKG